MTKLLEPAAIPGVRVYAEGYRAAEQAFEGESVMDPIDSPQPPFEAESPVPVEEPDEEEDDDLDDEEDEEEDDEDDE